MSTPTKRRLQLVPYSPDNYKPGEVLALRDATTITSPEAIGAALSLYFQWEKKRSSHILFSQGAEKKALRCRLDYDRDEASPTEIRVQLQKSKIGLKVVPGGTVLVRFEIFRVTYEFKSVVTATSDDPRKEGWHSILDVPSELRVIKSRQLPRVKLNGEMRSVLPPVSWQTDGAGDLIPIKIMEIGARSIRARCSQEQLEKSGFFVLGNHKIKAEVVRRKNEELILKMLFRDEAEFGAFFDFFRRVAYPSMGSRYEFPFEKGIELYKKSNYFGLFENGQVEEGLIAKTWKSLRSGFHKTNADYYILNNEGALTGCSGLALTNFSGNVPVWRFHQLCALRDPDLVEQSGILYSWRAEYLLARPGNLQASVSFRSESRWLERIYVKHALRNVSETQLHAVIEQRHTFYKADSQTNDRELKSYQMGSSRRVTTTTQHVWGAASPKYLNASANEDSIIAVFRKTSFEEIEAIGRNIAAELLKDSISMVCIFPTNQRIDGLMGTIGASDRFCIFQKSSLVNFVSSVEHSVAVTQRKLSSE